MSDTEDEQNISSEEEFESDYIDDLIDSIIKCYPEEAVIDPKRVYKTLVKRCRKIYTESKIRESDDFWQKLLTKAEEFVDKNDEIDVSDASSFEHAIKKFKVVILDKIKERLESSDDEDDGDEMNTEEMSVKEIVDKRAIS